MTNNDAPDRVSEPLVLTQPLATQGMGRGPWSGAVETPGGSTPGPTVGWTRRRQDVFGVIEVGAGRARFDVFRRERDGSFHVVWHDEEVISGGSPFSTAAVPAAGTGRRTDKALDERLVQTLRRFQRVCGRHHVTVGAVAHGSDALNNHPDALPRLFRMTGVPLKQVSDRETARLLCLGLLRGERPGRKSLVVDVGAEATLVVLADGEEPLALWRLGVGSAEPPDGDSRAGVRRLRAEVRQSLRQTRLDAIRGAAARALTGRERLEGNSTSAVTAGRTRVILEEIAAYLRLDGIRAVNRGLREGILFDLCRLARRAEN